MVIRSHFQPSSFLLHLVRGFLSLARASLLFAVMLMPAPHPPRVCCSKHRDRRWTSGFTHACYASALPPNSTKTLFAHTVYFVSGEVVSLGTARLGFSVWVTTQKALNPILDYFFLISISQGCLYWLLGKRNLCFGGSSVPCSRFSSISDLYPFPREKQTHLIWAQWKHRQRWSNSSWDHNCYWGPRH